MAINFPDDLEEKIKAEKISYGAAAALRFLEKKDRNAVCEFFTELRPTASVMKELSEHILDISKRDGISAEQIINAGNVKQITGMDCSRKIKTGKIRRLLRNKRYPSLTAKENELKDSLKKLALSGNISLRYPENFEGKKVLLTIRFESVAELLKAIAEIDKKTAAVNDFLKLL